MFPRNDMGGRNINISNVYILLAKCLKVVRKMCMARPLIIDMELSTDVEFNVKLQIVSRPVFGDNFLIIIYNANYHKLKSYIAKFWLINRVISRDIAMLIISLSHINLILPF